MRIAFIAVLLIGCTLGAPNSSPKQSSIFAAPTGSPCPAALHAGFLVELDGELVTDADGIPGGSVGRLIWQPWEYRVRADGDVFVVEDALGDVKAREGDYVRLGGGMNAADDAFIVCGAFEVSEAPPPTGPAQSSAATSADAACMATRDDIPLVTVESGTATLAAAYEVTGAQLAAYEASAFGPADPWEDDEVVHMCFFDGDFATMTPGPPEADRSAVRVLVVISDEEALLWSVARKDPSALPTTGRR